MIFSGRNLVKYPYSRYGYTRGGGKTWHGGIDVCGIDDDKIRMPGYNGKSIAGTVVTARIVTNKSNKTWEWGYYICVKLDANQTPDAVNYLYFCHCSKLLASVGQKVRPAMCWRLSDRPATPQAHGRTATLKCEPLPRARALTLRPMQPSPTTQASMALLRQRKSLSKFLSAAMRKLQCLLCKTSLLALSVAVTLPQSLRSARSTARRQTATQTPKITCRSSASAVQCSPLQTLCWPSARSARRLQHFCIVPCSAGTASPGHN